MSSDLKPDILGDEWGAGTWQGRIVLLVDWTAFLSTGEARELGEWLISKANELEAECSPRS